MVAVIAGAVPGFARWAGYGSGRVRVRVTGPGPGPGPGRVRGRVRVRVRVRVRGRVRVRVRVRGRGRVRDGYGSGDGSGYGDGSGPYWLATIEGFALKWPLTQQERLASLQAAGAKIAFWRSDAAGRPANGGRGVVAAPGVVHREKGPLNLCKRGTLHATLIPPAWKGERWWVVALIGEVVGDDKKMGALEREILGECL